VSGIQAYYFGARYFDPEVGLWTTVDPRSQFFNGYLYCFNNPLNNVDLAGEWSFKHFFSTFAAEFVRPFVEMGRAIGDGDAGKFFKNAFFGLSVTGAMLNMTEASGVATWAVLPDVQNNWDKIQKYGGFVLGFSSGDPIIGFLSGTILNNIEWKPEAGAHGGSSGDPSNYENYISAQKKNVTSRNPFKRWEAKGRIAHTTQDRKHHSNSSRIKGPWNMILSTTDFEHFEDLWPLIPDIPFMNSLRIWEGASDYYEEMYGYDLGL